MFAMNFADDAYVLGLRARDTTYTLVVIRKEYALVGQHLHAANSETLSPEASSEEVHMWTDDELNNYVSFGTTTAAASTSPGASVAARPVAPRVESTVILGSVVSLIAPSRSPASNKIQSRLELLRSSPRASQAKARHSQSNSTRFGGNSSTDVIVGYGVSAPHLSAEKTHQRYTTPHDRLLASGPTSPSGGCDELLAETRTSYYSYNSKTLPRLMGASTAPQIHYGFLGHVARLSPSTHMCFIVSLWRSSEWWQDCSTRLPDKLKQQPGRRAPHRGRPMPTGRSVVEAFKTLKRRAFFPEFNKRISEKNSTRHERGASLLTAERHIVHLPGGVPLSANCDRSSDTKSARRE